MVSQFILVLLVILRGLLGFVIVSNNGEVRTEFFIVFLFKKKVQEKSLRHHLLMLDAMKIFVFSIRTRAHALILHLR